MSLPTSTRLIDVSQPENGWMQITLLWRDQVSDVNFEQKCLRLKVEEAEHVALCIVQQVNNFNNQEKG